MEPLLFTFGVHIHQPVGNFGHVIEQHVRDVYRPFLERLAHHEFTPVALHLSGPLLECLETHDAAFLDFIGRMVVDGKLELLLGGFYEPVLASLPRQDRVEQIAWMREALERRFGVRAEGLWLTERVWEPELAADLAEAGVRFTLVDDRHFLVSGFAREALHAPFWTESGGKRVALFPIDERLRYLVPFKPPTDIVAYLRTLRTGGRRLAVLADDGEKFGGWPGTRAWVYGRGWLDKFLGAMRELIAGGEMRLSTFGDALALVPSGGLAYLPSVSYREMEMWALPPEAAARLAALERDLGEERLRGPEGALVRGAHWLNFFVRYPEANRAHKKMLALSALCRTRGDPPAARRAIGRAQCNDAYWHGVFGGLYLPHLREAVWRHLAIAERELRRDEPLVAEALDLDGDGHAEIWVHSAACSVVIAPWRGGAVEEYTLFRAETNYANTLTRRREAYHERHGEQEAVRSAQGDEGTTSIRELEGAIRLTEPPPLDHDDRALFLDRVLPDGLAVEAYARGDYEPLLSAARASFHAQVDAGAEAVVVRLRPESGPRYEKRIRIAADGSLKVTYRWERGEDLPRGVFAPEVSLAGACEIRCDPDTLVWSFPIETVAKSERGLEKTHQGVSLTPCWPLAAGEFVITIVPAVR